MTLSTDEKLFSRPGFLIRRLHQIHTGLFYAETQEFNMTPVQYSLLSALAERSELDQNALALEIGLERSSVAEVLPRLESRGLISRRPAESDKRVRLVRLTGEGADLVERMARAAQRAHDKTLEQLSEAERDVFMLQMIRLVESNNEHSVAPLKIQ